MKEQWAKLIERYLLKSEKLRVVFLLVDIRHEPSQNDKNMYDWIVYHGYNPLIIATKVDKLNRSQIQKHVKQIKTGLNVVDGTPVIPYSSLTKQGRDEIYEYIDGYYEDYLENEAANETTGEEE